MPESTGRLGRRPQLGQRLRKGASGTYVFHQQFDLTRAGLQVLRGSQKVTASSAPTPEDSSETTGLPRIARVRTLSTVPRSVSPDIDDRIIAACQAEIDKRGIIGMRVSAVAKSANTTVAMIYRRFVDRDGLLAHTLGAYYRNRISAVIETIEKRLAESGSITIDDVMELTPVPHHRGSEELHRNLPRITVIAAENFALRVIVEQVMREGMRQLEDAMNRLVDRMPEDQQFDPRIFTYFMVNLTWMYNDLRGDEAISNEEFKDFVRGLLKDSKRPG